MNKAVMPILLVGSPDKALDIRYRTGFAAPDAVVYLEDKRQKHLIVSALELGRSKRVAAGITVWSPADLKIAFKDQASILSWILALLRHLGISSIIVAPDFAFGIVKKLIKNGIHVCISKGALFPQRQIKTAKELKDIRQSQEAAIHAMYSAVEAIEHAHIDRFGYLRSGRNLLTADLIRLLINQTLLDHNCFCQDTIVACGKRSADPHEMGSGPLSADKSIVIDIFPRNISHGYCGDLTRTIVKGKAPADLKKMYNAVQEAQKNALGKVKAGVSAAVVHRAACAVFKNRGLATGIVNSKPHGFIHNTGHGVGLAIHEEPAIGRQPIILASGNVITIEPGLYYPSSGGVRIEDLIVVKPAGWQYLGKCKHFFEV